MIAVVTITAGELIAGESIGKGDRRTTFGGGKTNQKDTKHSADDRQGETTEERPTDTEEETPAEQPTETETTPIETTETARRRRSRLPRRPSRKPRRRPLPSGGLAAALARVPAERTPR